MNIANTPGVEQITTKCPLATPPPCHCKSVAAKLGDPDARSRTLTKNVFVPKKCCKEGVQPCLRQSDKAKEQPEV
jgi:hypothetical protein